MFNIVQSKEPNYEPRIPLFFDTDRYDVDRFPLINGFSKRFLDSRYFIPRENNFEGYSGLFGPKFLRLFEPIISNKNDRKYYYPIFITLINIIDIFHEISIPDEVIADIINQKCKILLACPYEGWDWTYWQKLAQIIIEKFDLKISDIVVLCGNYAESKFPTVTFNVWEYFREYDDTKVKDKDYICKLIDDRTARKYKFICLNRRPTPERFAITTLLFPYRDQGLLTCAKIGGQPVENTHYQIDQFRKKYPQEYPYFELNIKDILPIQFKDEAINPEIENPADDFNTEKFLNSYLYVVTETFFETVSDRMFFSEKVFKPIVFMMPFVLIAQPHSLKKLQDLGYKTFHPFIDESYDSEVDERKRMMMVFEQIRRIIELEIDQLNDLMCQLLPILLHNKKNLHLRCSNIILPTLHKDLLEKLNTKF